MQTKPRYRIGSDGSNPRAIGLPVPVAVPVHGRTTASYMRGERSPFFFGWNPVLRDMREDVRMGYIQAAARAIDGIQNSGWLSGAIDQSIGSMLGTGLRLASKPDHVALGWDKATADQWSRDVERRFEGWCRSPLECDAAGKQTTHQQARSVVLNYYSHGEALALLPMIDRRVSKTRTKIKMLPPHKLVQDSDGERMVQGVIMDGWGLPLAYRMMLRINQSIEEPVVIRARDAAGRPQVAHIFDGQADQVRGITVLAPALKVVRQFDQLSNAKLEQELLHALFAATVHSPAPTDGILNALRDDSEQGVAGGSLDSYLGAKVDWYQSTKIDYGNGGKVVHLFPGEDLKFLTANANNEDYEAFAKFLLREIARGLGMTFETLTGDYTGATYSSVRMATSEIWPVILWRRQNIPGRFYQIVFEAWLEEEIDAGRQPFPGGFEAFLMNREAACRADWRGPPKPQADDLKAAKAHETYKRLGVVTDEMICNDLGADVEDVYDQREHEKKMREQRGLPDGDTLAPDPVADRLVTQA